MEVHRENERGLRIDDRVREHAREVLQSTSIDPGEGKTWRTLNEELDLIVTGGDIHDPNPADNITAHLFAITAEIQRASRASSYYTATGEISSDRIVASGSTQHSVRAAFERAAKSRSCQNSPALWTIWVDWECALLASLGPVSAEKARQCERIKHVFFRGLRNLPWVKGYALMAFGVLVEKGVMGDKECRAVYEGMVAKGLRVVFEL